MTPPLRRAATLANVAELAGVSLKTASRVMRGEPNVSPDTTARTLRAARKVGYRRNAAASLLAQRRVIDTVGLIIGDITNPFYSAIAQGFEDEVASAGITLMLASTSEREDREMDLAMGLADAGARALVVASALPDHAHYAALIARDVAVVFVDRPPRGIEADHVVFDNRGAGRAAAGHLLEQGHRSLAFIGDYAWLSTFRERLAGTREAADAASATLSEVTDVHDAEGARAAVRSLLASSPAPTGIIAGNNRILAGVVHEVTGTRPDVAIVGFDDVEWAEMLGLSVLATDGRAMGREAARLVLARLEDPAGPVQSVVLRAPLVVRGATRSAP